MNKQDPDSEKNETKSPEDRTEPFKLSARVDVALSSEAVEAANAPAKLFDAVEAARTNKHSGSAGGDQAYSIEIVMDDGNRVSRLNPQTAGGSSKGSISREELQAKASSGDGFATSYLKQMEACDWLSEKDRSIRLNEIQKQADLTYGRKTTLLIGSVSMSESAMPDGNLDFLYEQMVPSDELVMRLGAFKDARTVLVQSSIDLGYGKEKIDRLGIADDDVGSALALYLLGPDIFERIGKSQSRDLGNNLLIFGIAPLFGACETAAQKWEKEKAELGVEGSVNFCLGTFLGAALERMHPAVAGGLALAGISALVHDAFLSDAAMQRNRSLSTLASHAGGLDSASVLKYSHYTKEAIGPVLYKQAFDFATSGVAVPPGASLSRGLREEALEAGETAVKRPFSKVEVDSLIDRFWHMPLGAVKNFWRAISRESKPELAYASATDSEVQEPLFKPVEELFLKMVRHGEPPMSEYERRNLEFNQLLRAGLSNKYLNMRASDDVVLQIHPDACVSACAEMATKGEFSQKELVAKFDSMSPTGKVNCRGSLVELPLLIGEKWSFKFISQAEAMSHISSRVNWIAEFKVFGEGAHVVMVDGMDSAGNLMIRDSGIGKRYELKVSDFLQYWNGNAVFEK